MLTSQSFTSTKHEPPPDVMVRWINYVLSTSAAPAPPPRLTDYLTDYLGGRYTTHGKWDLPPLNDKVSQDTADQLKDSSKKPSVAEPPPVLETIKSDGRKAAKPKRIRQKTGFDYASSDYYAQAKSRLEPESFESEWLKQICLEVLAVLVAFSYHTLFNHRRINGRKFSMVSFDVLAREFTLRQGDVGYALKVLQQKQILKPGLVSTGIISHAEFNEIRLAVAALDILSGGGENGVWSQRVLQTKSMVYVLNFELPEDLGVFVPFAMKGNTYKERVATRNNLRVTPNQLGLEFGQHLETPNLPQNGELGVDGKVSATPNLAGNTLNPNITCRMNHDESMNHDDDEKVILSQKAEKSVIPEKLLKQVAELVPEQQAIFQFIAQEAHINGICLNPYSIGDILAKNESLTLETAQQTYQNTLEALQGENKDAITSPLGLFRRCLEKGILDPRFSRPPSEKMGRKKEVAVAKPPKASTAVLVSQLKENGQNFGESILPDEVEQTALNSFNPPSTLDCPALWKEVCRALDFKSGKRELAKLLAPMTLTEIQAGKALVQPVAAHQIRLISQSDLTLVGLLLSQKVGSATQIVWQEK
jgi:hypothetical protein